MKSKPRASRMYRNKTSKVSSASLSGCAFNRHPVAEVLGRV
ncbi:hypothetical protein [Mycobacterium sp. ZZG]